MYDVSGGKCLASRFCLLKTSIGIERVWTHRNSYFVCMVFKSALEAFPERYLSLSTS